MDNDNSNFTLNYNNVQDLDEEFEITEISSLYNNNEETEYQYSDDISDINIDIGDVNDFRNYKNRNIILQKVIGFFNSLEKVYCPDEALENLKNYKYNSVDKSYVSKYILKPYWEFCTKLFPLSMAYVIMN